jgi:hypothetical protein
LIDQKQYHAKGISRVGNPTVPSGILIRLNREISLFGKIIHCTTLESASDAWLYQHQSAHCAHVFSKA